MMSLITTLSRSYLIGKKGRSLMTLLGIALGVTMTVAVMLTVQAIMDSYEDVLIGAAGRADLQVSSLSGSSFPASVLDEVVHTQGVRAAVPAVTSGAPAINGERQTSATFYGVDLAQEQQVRDYRWVKGRLPAAEGTKAGAGPTGAGPTGAGPTGAGPTGAGPTGAAEAAISTDLAAALQIDVGDTFSLLTVSGLKRFTVTGVFDSAGTTRGALGPFGVMPLETAQTVFGREGKLDLIDILAAESTPPKTLQARLGERLDGRVRVGTPLERSKEMQEFLDSVNLMMTMVGSLALFAGAFIIYTNVFMGVTERRRELAILRAVGMRRAEVIRLVLGEVALLGLLGSALGLAWGFGLAQVMATQMTDQFLAVYKLSVTRVTLSWSTMGIGLGVGLGTALFSALGPALEAVRFSPVEAMRPDSEQGRQPERFSWVRGGAGLLVIAAGYLLAALNWPEQGRLADWQLRLWAFSLVVMLLGVVLLMPLILKGLHRLVLRPVLTGLFGVTGSLAAGNLLRQPRRTAATVSALLVSLVFMVAVGGVSVSQRTEMRDWYERQVAWDLHVSTSFGGVGAQVEMEPGFAEALKEVDGVWLVTPQKFVRLQLADGHMALMQAFDTESMTRYTGLALEEGDPKAVAARLSGGGAVLISPAIARRLGLAIGDTLALPAPGGPVSFQIVGLISDPTPFGGTIQIDRADYIKYWQDETASAVALKVKEGVDPLTVRRAILDRWGSQMHLAVRSNDEYWAELERQVDGFYGLLNGLMLIAILVSGLAIANTLLAAVLERRRELGVMRALGARRREIRAMVFGEGLSIGTVGALIGIPLGLVLEWAMIQGMAMSNGASLDVVVSGAVILSAAGTALLLVPLSGLLPAQYAARLDVVDSLRYE